MTRKTVAGKAMAVADVLALFVIAFAVLVILVIVLQTFDPRSAPMDVPLRQQLCVGLLGMAALLHHRRCYKAAILLIVVVVAMAVVSNFSSSALFGLLAVCLVFLSAEILALSSR